MRNWLKKPFKERLFWIVYLPITLFFVSYIVYLKCPSHRSFNFILGFIITVLPFVPYAQVQPEYCEYLEKKGLPSKHWSYLQIIVSSLLELLTEFANKFNLKGTVTVLVFGVAGVDLYFNKTLNPESVSLVSIGIISLYLEYLISNAKKITMFKILEYESKNDSDSSKQDVAFVGTDQ